MHIVSGLHYAVSVNLAKPSDARSIVNGKLLLSVSGEKTETVQLAPPMYVVICL